MKAAPAGETNASRRARLLQALLFLSLYVWAFLSSLRPIHEYDFWWHLAGGRLFFAKGIPSVDPFSLTCRGRTWINTFWLLEAGLYGLYRGAGLNAIVIAQAAAVCAVLWFQQRMLAALGAGWASRAAVFVAFFLSFSPASRNWVSQVSLVTMIFCAALWADIEACRRDDREPRLAVWLPLFALWANMHRGVVIGLAIAGLYALAQARRGPQALARAMRFPALAAAATLVNPYGVGLYRMIWSDFTFSPAHIHNWATTNWSSHREYWLAGAALWALLARRIARRDKHVLFHALAAALFSWLAARSLVNAPYLSLFALPLLGAAASDALRGRLPRAPLAQEAALAAALAFALAAAATARSRGGLDASSVPIGACDFIAQENLRGPFFNDYRFGGYFLWRFGGDPAVFIDGRNVSVDGYGTLLTEIETAKTSPALWEAFLRRDGVHGALTTYPEGAPSYAPFDAYFPRARWALVDWDDVSLLFLERTPENRATIQRAEFKALSPDGGPQTLAARARAADPATRRRIESELRRALAEQPDGARVRNLARAYAQAVSPAAR